MYFRRFALLAFFLALGVACTDKDLPMSPKLVPSIAQDLIVPPSMSNVSLPVSTITNPAYTLALPTYDDTVLVEFRIDDKISVTSLPITAIQPYRGDLDGSGIYVESGFSMCAAYVQFAYDTVGRSGPSPCRFAPVPASFWVDTVRVRGHGIVTRAVGIPQYTQDCNYTPCHTYSSAQRVSVTPLAALLQISASGTTHAPGGTISFNASVTPDSIHHISVP
jgi:hypothetical protein